MKLTVAFLAALGCSSHAGAPIANAEPAPAARRVVLRGTVYDYAKRTVANARVSGDGREVRTDAHGRFTLEVPPRSRVSASIHDMYGSIAVGAEPEQHVIIRMAQMPE